jgi:hypothetical protein
MRKKSRGDSWKIQRDLGEAPGYPNWESRGNIRKGKKDTEIRRKCKKIWKKYRKI